MPAPVLPIRQLGPHDAALAHVWERLERGDLCDEIGSRVELSLFAACNDRGVWAAFDRNEVVAYAAARVVRACDIEELCDEWPALSEHGVAPGWVYLLFAETDPTYRRRGLHRALIDTRLRWAEQLGAPGALVFSWCHPGATSTGQLRAAGFTDAATVVGYFAGDVADVIFMTRRFGPATCGDAEPTVRARSTTTTSSALSAP
jgi:GNAT superfamily N-acetyltransferase